MRQLILDGAKQKTPADVYKFFAAEFDFGSYFGKNPDALYDFMVPIDNEDRPLIIEWTNTIEFINAFPEDYKNLVHVFERISAFGQHNPDVFQFKLT